MTSAKPEHAAQSIRRDCGEADSTLIDVYKTVELRGAHVLLAPITGGPEGCFGRIRGEAWIFANTIGVAKLDGWLDRARLRFTLAHELGHMELGHGAKVDVNVETGRSVRGDERQANTFAAELLMPLAGVRWYLDEVLRVTHVTSLDELVSLAGHFGVSCSVALYRVDTAKRITPTYKNRIDEALTARQHLTAERKVRMRSYSDSLKDLISLEPARRYRPPSTMNERVARAWSAGLLSVTAASDYLHMPEADFRTSMRELGIDEPEAGADGDDGWW